MAKSQRPVVMDKLSSSVCYEEAVVEMSNLLKMTMSEWRSRRRKMKIKRPPREEREATERCREES
jgi:hypothetical protein